MKRIRAFIFLARERITEERKILASCLKSFYYTFRIFRFYVHLDLRTRFAVEARVNKGSRPAVTICVVEISAYRLRSFAKQCASLVQSDNSPWSRWTSSRAFRDDARHARERIAYTPRLRHCERTWHELRVRRLLCRSKTSVLKFVVVVVVSRPVRSDVSLRVEKRERTATLTLCTRAYLHYVRVVTQPREKNGYIFARHARYDSTFV